MSYQERPPVKVRPRSPGPYGPAVLRKTVETGKRYSGSRAKSKLHTPGGSGGPTRSHLGRYC